MLFLLVKRGEKQPITNTSDTLHSVVTTSVALEVNTTDKVTTYSSNKTSLNNESEDGFNEKEYTYDAIRGLYKHIGKTMTNEVGNEYFAYFYLWLDENGTFTYEMGTGAPFGYMGNYIIKDNTIVLNYLFSTGSGAEIRVTTGSKTLTFTAENMVVDANPLVTVGGINKVTLKKVSLTEESEYLQGGGFEQRLNNSYISNDATNY